MQAVLKLEVKARDQRQSRLQSHLPALFLTQPRVRESVLLMVSNNLNSDCTYFLTSSVVVGTARDVDGDARAAGPRPAVSQQVPPYRRGAAPVKSTVWAEPPAIEKTKQKRDKEMREEHVRRENKYLGQPDTQEELPGTVRISSYNMNLKLRRGTGILYLA